MRNVGIQAGCREPACPMPAIIEFIRLSRSVSHPEGGSVVPGACGADVEAGPYEPGRRHEIEMPISIEVKDEGLKAPLPPRPQGQRQ